MSKKSWTKLEIAGIGAIVISFAASGAALADYSGHVGRRACRAAGACTVYDSSGLHEVPCWPTKTAMAYPGDPGWPFEPGVCDTVEQMNAPWPETGAATTATSTTNPASTARITTRQ